VGLESDILSQDFAQLSSIRLVPRTRSPLSAIFLQERNFAQERNNDFSKASIAFDTCHFRICFRKLEKEIDGLAEHPQRFERT
jgi:hypothetical protein